MVSYIKSSQTNASCLWFTITATPPTQITMTSPDIKHVWTKMTRVGRCHQSGSSSNRHWESLPNIKFLCTFFKKYITRTRYLSVNLSNTVAVLNLSCKGCMLAWRKKPEKPEEVPESGRKLQKWAENNPSAFMNLYFIKAEIPANAGKLTSLSCTGVKYF